MKERFIQFGYVAALSMMLSAIIYFFAANWAGIDRWGKITLSMGLLILFYGSSFLLTILFKRRPLTSELCLFAGGITFGVTVALLGQIYNSHADSFMLFAVWAIPALLFSVVTKYQPFYVLTYILIHASVWLFLFPSSGFQVAEEYWYRSFFFGAALVNIALFVLIEKGLFRSPILSFFGATVFHALMLVLSTGEWFEFFPSVMSVFYMSILGSWCWYVLRKGSKKTSILLLGIAITLFIIIKFVTFLIFVDSEFIFLLTSFFPVILVGAAVWLLSKWKGHLKEQSWLRRIFIGAIAGVASVIGASSVAGVLLLFIGEVSSSVLVMLALVVFILPAVLKSSWDPLVRHTLLLTGYLMGIPAAIFSHLSLSFLLLGAFIFVFCRYASRAIQHITYLAGMSTLAVSLLNEGVQVEEMFLLLLSVNVALFIAHRFVQGERNVILHHNSYVYGLMAFFVLTFLYETNNIVYFVVNSLYFILTSILLVYALRANRLFEYRVGVVFWFAYLAYKYYDVLWSLLHKSITFFIIGLLLLLLTKRYDRLSGDSCVSVSFVSRRWLPILAIIVIQFGMIGGQIVKSETLLAEGKTIRLELQPVDPRSLLQGDYMILRYSISTLTLEPEPLVHEKVSIGLIQDEKGVYEYSGTFVKGNALKASSGVDVWITGRYKGSGHIEYGIENYFVSEGEGLELEQKAKYANVKVSESGDALLSSLDGE